MRITNKIIQNNSLTNINNNKILQDTLSTQVATGKKIARPSDDPIVALRSLRLRTSVNQTDQYLEKNVNDARSWLTVTEDAINTLSEIITDMRKSYVKGSSDSLTVSDRDIIRQNLESLQKEIFNTGNADFAGRSVFTGYRTDEPLTFQENEANEYSITEVFAKGTEYLPDKITYVSTGDLDAAGATEQQVSTYEITRLRLAYDSCMDATISLNCINPDGTAGATTVTTMSVADVPSPYDYISTSTNDEAVFIHETGEVLFSSKAAAKVEGYLERGITVEYTKEKWLKGDLKPEHYFKCTDVVNSIDYNVSSSDGEIEYNIGVNQVIRVNTLAKECFNHATERDIDDLMRAIDEVEEIEELLAKQKKELDAIPEANVAQRKAVQDKIDATRKAQTFKNDKLQRMFSAGITKADNYLKTNNLALTDCGTRSKRLDLIENRLDTQMTTLQELKSDNEDSDLAQTAIKLSSSKYAYDASLMSSGKILQESLLNYI